MVQQSRTARCVMKGQQMRGTTIVAQDVMGDQEGFEYLAAPQFLQSFIRCDINRIRPGQIAWMITKRCGPPCIAADRKESHETETEAAHEDIKVGKKRLSLIQRNKFGFSNHNSCV